VTASALVVVITLMVGNIAALFSLGVFRDLDRASKRLRRALRKQLGKKTIEHYWRENIKLLLSVPILAANLASTAFLYFLVALLARYLAGRYVLCLPAALRWDLTERDALVLAATTFLSAVSYGCQAIAPFVKGWYLVFKGISKTTLSDYRRRHNGGG
jgi:hypothetical protein